jgi:hypothetical protein
MRKKKDTRTKSYLTSTQEVLYSKTFKQADRAAGYKQNGIG